MLFCSDGTVCCFVVMVQCVAVYVLQYVAVCCSLLQRVAVRRSVCLAACCSMLQGVALYHDGGKFGKFTVTKKLQHTATYVYLTTGRQFMKRALFLASYVTTHCNTLQHMCT